jgi:hypothetical protein
MGWDGEGQWESGLWMSLTSHHGTLVVTSELVQAGGDNQCNSSVELHYKGPTRLLEGRGIPF